MPAAEVVKGLQSSSVEQRLAFVDALDGRESDSALALLIEALSDAKWVVRRLACERISTCGDRALVLLEKMLLEGSDDQKFWAVRSMVGLGSKALPCLLRSLADGNPPMRMYSAQALGELGDRKALGPLIKGLADPAWRVRKACFDGLAQFGPRALPHLREAIGSDNEDTVYWAAKAMGRLGELSRATLLDALKKGSSQLKFILAAALGESGDDRVIALLIHNLRGGPWILQKRSADALAEIGPKAADPLAAALPHAHPPQDFWLVQALGRLGKPGIDRLATVFINRGESFRWDKRDVLARIGEPLFSLHAQLFAHDSRDVRLFAIACLGDLKLSREADELLLKALSDSSWSVRKAAADALAERGPLILDRLNLAMATDNEDVRYWVTHVFKKMGDLGVVYLVRALKDPNRSIGFFAAQALGDVRQREVVKPLIEALRDPSWPIRRVAAESLARLGSLAARDLLDQLNDDDQHVQYWTTKAIRAMGAGGVPELVRILRRGADDERYLAAKALGILRHPSSREGLVEALADGHEWVRTYAALALAELDDFRSVEYMVVGFGEPSFKLNSEIYGVFLRFGEKALPALLNVLQEGHPIKVRNALRVLGRMSLPASFDAIGPFLAHPSDEVKLAAVDALSGFPDNPRTTGLLTGVLGTASDRVKGRVLSALGEAGGDEGIRQMVISSAMAGDEKETRQVSAAILRQGPKAIPALIGMLGSDKVPLRKTAAELLVRMGTGVRSAVEKVLAAEDKNARYWAQRVLRDLDASAGGEPEE